MAFPANGCIVRISNILSKLKKKKLYTNLSCTKKTN